MNDDASGAVFDANIRRFLGARGAVNADIRRTCTAPDTSYLFWFLNNGITIVCDSVDPVTDPDNAHLKVRNIQIVNGCQTATTLAMAERDGLLAPDARVLLRIYETQDAQLVDKMVLTTNNQNKISSRDLRANDQVQVDMERAFASYGLLYERKVRQFDRQPGVDATQIRPNETVAQSYLAIVLKMPSDARTRKYKVWGELYDRIFSGQAPAGHILAAEIYRDVAQWTQSSPLASDRDEVRRKVVKNGAFHLARVVAFLWRGTDSFNVAAQELDQRIEQLKSDPTLLHPFVPDALTFIENLIRSTQRYCSDVDAALKVATLDTDITAALHSRGSASSP